VLLQTLRTREPGELAEVLRGRFTLRKPAEEMAAYFQAHGIPAWSPHYNISPTQESDSRRQVVRFSFVGRGRV
jgi:hypothetical protein